MHYDPLKDFRHSEYNTVEARDTNADDQPEFPMPLFEFMVIKLHEPFIIVFRRSTWQFCAGPFLIPFQPVSPFFRYVRKLLNEIHVLLLSHNKGRL